MCVSLVHGGHRGRVRCGIDTSTAHVLAVFDK